MQICQSDPKVLKSEINNWGWEFAPSIHKFLSGYRSVKGPAPGPKLGLKRPWLCCE